MFPFWNFLIKFISGDHQINPDPSGWYIKSDEGYQLYDRDEQELMDEVHPYLETNAGWLALKTTEDWMLLPRNRELQPSRGYDSLKLVNDHAVLTMQRSGKQLLFSSGVSVPLGIDYTVRSFTGHEAYATHFYGGHPSIFWFF